MQILKFLLAVVCSLLLLGIVLVTSFAFEVDRTLLNPEFVTSEIEQADLISAGKTYAVDNLPEQARPFAPAVAAAFEEQRPWLRTQIRSSVDTTYAYFTGKTDRWQIDIDAEPFRQSLLKSVRRQLQENPPPDYKALSSQERAQVSAEIEKTIYAFELPQKFNFDSLNASEKAEVLKLRARIATFKTVYMGLIGAGVLLTVLLLWAGSSFWVAVIGLICGTGLHMMLLISQGVGALVPTNQIAQLPPALQAYVPTFTAHLAGPFKAYAWGCLLAGVFFLVLGYVLRSMRRAFAAKPASA